MKNKRKILLDLKTHDRIREHLSNKSDIISDEDILNAKTEQFDEGISLGNNESGSVRNEDPTNTSPNEKDGDTGPGMITPWNILGS